LTLYIPHADGDEVSDAGFASIFHNSPEHVAILALETL